MGLTGNAVRGRQRSHPAPILHPDRHIQSQPTLESRTVNPPRYVDLHPSLQYVYDIAWDEAHREKDQDAQDKQGRDDQQPPPDHVGSHIFVVGNYSAGVVDVRLGGSIGLPAKTLVNASITLPPFLRMVEI